MREHDAKNIVVDPVMVATSGAGLIREDAVEALRAQLLSVADLVTPNIPEGEILTGMKIHNRDDMEDAAEKMSREYGCAVLIKGGHSLRDAHDCLCENGEITWFYGKRIDNPNNHGTGCTLSSAISACLAKGYSIKDSIRKSKTYLEGALKSGLDLGGGKGPLNHFYFLK